MPQRGRPRILNIPHPSTSPEYRRAYQRLRYPDSLPGGQGRVINPNDPRLRTQDIRITRWASKAKKHLRTSAKARGIQFDRDVTSAWVKGLFSQQRGRCFYTGIRFEITAEKRGMRRPSLDRRDSSKGYTRDNLVLCLVAVNYAKNDWSEEAFIGLLDLIRRHHPISAATAQHTPASLASLPQITF